MTDKNFSTPHHRPPIPLGALLLIWLAALVPLWWPRFLPLGALSEQVAIAAVWHRLGDPAWGYQPFYAVRSIPEPGWGFHLLAHPLAWLVPVEAGARLLLSAYALALPLSLALLARRLGRSPWLAILAGPLVFGWSLGQGHVGLVLGLPTALFGVVALDRFLDGPTAPRLMAVVALAAFTWLLDPLPFAMLAAGAAVLLLARARPWRPAAAGAATVLSVAAIGYAQLHRMAVSTPGAAAAEWERLLDTAELLPHRLLLPVPGGVDELGLVTLAIAWLLLATTARAGRPPDPSQVGLRAWVPELFFLIVAAAHLALPARVTHPLAPAELNAHLAVAAALLGALLPRGLIEGRRRLLLLPPLLVALAFPLHLAIRFHGFDARAAGLARLVERVPRGSSVLSVVVDGVPDPAVDLEPGPLRAAHAWVHLRAGGFDPYLPDAVGPIAVRPDRRLPAPERDHPRDLDAAAIGARYDFVLTHGESGDGKVFRGPGPPVIDTDGAWRLYHTGSPR